MANQIEKLLVANSLSAVRDKTEHERVMGRVLAQDILLSPPKFNAYIDTLIEDAIEQGITTEV